MRGLEQARRFDHGKTFRNRSVFRCAETDQAVFSQPGSQIRTGRFLAICADCTRPGDLITGEHSEIGAFFAVLKTDRAVCLQSGSQIHTGRIPAARNETSGTPAFRKLEVW